MSDILKQDSASCMAIHDKFLVYLFLFYVKINNLRLWEQIPEQFLYWTCKERRLENLRKFTSQNAVTKDFIAVTMLLSTK